jgi:hypothetical protein
MVEDEIMCNIDGLAKLVGERMRLMELVASLREENDRLRAILCGKPGG